MTQTDPIIEARRQGAAIERNRIIHELRLYALEVTKDIPAHVGAGFAQIVFGGIDKIRATGEESDRADAR